MCKQMWTEREKDIYIYIYIWRGQPWLVLYTLVLKTKHKNNKKTNARQGARFHGACRQLLLHPAACQHVP